MTKPKRLSRGLWLFSAFYIVYGTAIPFRFHLEADYLRVRLSAINWYPLQASARNGWIILPDYFQNILLFIPFGFLGYVAITQKQALWKSIAIVMLAGLLSTSVEVMQIFSETRFPALTDVIFNTLGAAVGVLAAMKLRTGIANLHSRPWLRKLLETESAFPALLFAILSIAVAWEPFNFSLEPVYVLQKIHDAWQRSFSLWPSADDFLSLSRHACLTLFVCRWLDEVKQPAGKIIGAGSVLLLGLGLELSQYFIETRMPAIQDAMVLILGILLGFTASSLPLFRTHSHTSGYALVLGFAAAIACQDLYPFEFVTFSGGFNFIPFRPYLEHVSFAALSDFGQEVLAYFCIGFVGSRFALGKPRSMRFTIPLALCLSVTIEALQRGIPGHFADITEVIGALVGVLSGHWAITEGRRHYEDYLRQARYVGQTMAGPEV